MSCDKCLYTIVFLILSFKCLKSGHLLNKDMRKHLHSAAKINLGLSIVGRRADGYHLLESLFWPLSFGDSLEISPGSGKVSLTWDESAPFPIFELPDEANNIVSKVLRALPNTKLDFDVCIKKQIPIGGGMGGGSSNVGTLLRYLKSENKLQIPTLNLWSCQFGADIPFFMYDSPAWVSGVGENVLPIKCDSQLIKNLYFLVVLFPFGCETKRIFSTFKELNKPFSAQTHPFQNGTINKNSFETYLKSAKNDLEPMVSELYPDIRRILTKLNDVECLYSGLSGSGSTCFAVFDCLEKLQKTSKDLQSFFRSNNCKSIFAETYTTH